VAKFPSNAKTSPSMVSETDVFQGQLRSLLTQKKYRQALEEIKKVRRQQPDVQFQPTEAEIWSLRGQQEFLKADFRQAENSFRQALNLGLGGVAHYWLAKSLLALNRLDAALDLIRLAFEHGTLPKDFAICYLKLLLLKGDLPTVEQLITQQTKRFSAAQLHWARGVLALKQGDPETALTALQKVKRGVTSGDLPDAWIVYAQQAIGQWEAAATKLGLPNSPNWNAFYGKPKFLDQPILMRLATFQQAKTGKFDTILVQQADQISKEVMNILALVSLLDQGNHHDAGHALLQAGQNKRFPELAILRSPLLKLAGQQAFAQGELECAAQLWQPLVNEPTWDPQLAVNLLEVLELNDAGQERQRLLTRLVKWLEQEAKQHPEQWPEDRLKLTLAHAHCRLADAWMALDRVRTALGEVQQAERICPTSPEVWGRQGLIAADDDRPEAAIDLLTRAIEGGCRNEDVYESLLNCWRQLENPGAVNEARRRYGKFFGDLNVETEMALAPWVEALATRNYALYSQLVEGDSVLDPALRACQIFVAAAHGQPTSGGKIALNQATAIKQWAALLQKLAPPDQVPVLEAIALSLQLLAKREKGIAALITDYMLKLVNITDVPEAKVAHLVVLAAKEGNNPQRLQVPMQFYLATTPQPGNALAAVQLRLRFFAQTTILRSFLDAALAREPQNPLLLLAKATTFPSETPPYEDLKEQGFDLARRLQDAKALQAFRVEQAFLATQLTQSVLPSSGQLENLGAGAMESMLEDMIRKMFGSKMPKAELDRMMPILKQQIFNQMPGADDDDDDFSFGDIFGRSSRKGKRSFRDL
jgi:tetratricopeptide (TPR) repeat protein